MENLTVGVEKDPGPWRGGDLHLGGRERRGPGGGILKSAVSRPGERWIGMPGNTPRWGPGPGRRVRFGEAWVVMCQGVRGVTAQGEEERQRRAAGCFQGCTALPALPARDRPRGARIPGAVGGRLCCGSKTTRKSSQSGRLVLFIMCRAVG